MLIVSAGVGAAEDASWAALKLDDVTGADVRDPRVAVGVEGERVGFMHYGSRGDHDVGCLRAACSQLTRRELEKAYVYVGDPQVAMAVNGKTLGR